MKTLAPSLLTPDRIGRMLKVGRSFVYKKLDIGQSGGIAVPAQAITDWLNSCRTNPTMPELDEPIPLLSEEDVAPLVTVDGQPATVEQIRRFAKRRLFPIPAFKLSPKIVRFPYGAVQWWLSYLDSPIGVKYRRYCYGAAPRSSTSITHTDYRNKGVRAAKKEA